MSPVPQSEMLDELAVDVMDLQSQMADESNKSKHKQMIKKMIDKNFTGNKYQPIPEFEKGMFIIGFDNLQLLTVINTYLQLSTVC